MNSSNSRYFFVRPQHSSFATFNDPEVFCNLKQYIRPHTNPINYLIITKLGCYYTHYYSEIMANYRLVEVEYLILVS